MAGMMEPARRESLLTALRVGSGILFFGAWQLTAMSHVFSEFLLPSVPVVAERLWHDLVSGDLVSGIVLTLIRTFIGFALAAVGGIILGVSIARVPLVRWFFDPLVSAGLPMPKVAFLPIFMLWFGVFDTSKILMVAFSSIFPVIVEAWAGTQNIDKYMTWSAMSLGVNRHRFLWEIALPAALPQVFTGLQVALPIALIVDIVCEMQMGGEGMGGSIMTDMRFADSPGVFAYIVAIAIVGMVLVKAMEITRRRLLLWHQETQTA
ncbi:MAG: ABC transporter permease [Alphaproteobacteria bacterium]|nr:ABC transporter permease [Alphaproteobacteria bacterium]